MKILLSIFLLMITLSVFSASADTIPASNKLIEYTGRIDFANPEAPEFSYSGVSIRASFTGTSIAMIMDDDIGQNYYDLILDGRMLDTVRVTKGRRIYQIASGLKDTIHEIEIFKRTEEMFGKTRFFGFVVDKGASLTAIADKRPLLIEYIGNSITCGYGDEGVLGGKFGPTTEDHYMTYAAVTSRNFNARHLAVCKSGIGIYRNYNGPAEGNKNTMTNNYTRIFLYDEKPEYSFKETPDLVCINLGTNDFSTTGGDSALYVSNYFRLIDTVQSKYTMPDVVCLLGPMLSGPNLIRVRKYLTFIADSANRKGKGRVTFFEMSQQTGDLGIGIDYHPTVAQHKRNGMELTEYIQSLKGWKITPLVINANVTGTRNIQLEFNTPVNDPLNRFTGFIIYGDNTPCTIDSVYSDAGIKIVHILLNEDMQAGEKIYVNYVPGTLVSDDAVKVGRINRLRVQNNLTAKEAAVLLQKRINPTR